MVWKYLALTAAVVVAVASVAGYFYYLTTQQHHLIEISKQSSRVQSYLNQHPSAKCDITKRHLTADGMVHAVDDNWKLKELLGSAGDEPADGKDHYCWVVQWYDPTSMIEHIVNVFIDRDSLEIILVTEAW